MSKTRLALVPITYIAFVLGLAPSRAAEQFSIVNESFFGQGNSAVQPVLARHSPPSVLTPDRAPEGACPRGLPCRRPCLPPPARGGPPSRGTTPLRRGHVPSNTIFVDE